jgi:hypothetical protein
MTQNQLEEKIYQIYKTDVLAIKNLADTATKLQAGCITIPGALTVSGGCTINGNTNTDTLNIKTGCTINGGSTINGGATIKGNVIITGDIIIKGRLMFNELKKWWMQDAIPNLKHLGREDVGYDQKAGYSVSIVNFNPDANPNYNDWRMATFANDGNICSHASGQVKKCINCDRRVKENIIAADTCNLLTKINKLPIQNYNFIDKKFYKGQEVYGLIAQEVKEIFPEAVEITKQHIPNINKLAEHKLVEDNILLYVENNTKVNDNILLFVNDRLINAKVASSSLTTIIVSKWDEYKENDNVLVYGTEIDDFHGLNQQYMGILSLGGIQELSKQIDILKSENNILKQSYLDIITELKELRNLLCK